MDYKLTALDPAVRTKEPADLVLTHKEWMAVQKLRQARRLAESGHRSRLEIMFYDGGRSCDMTIEDRERVVEKLVDRDMK